MMNFTGIDRWNQQVQQRPFQTEKRKIVANFTQRNHTHVMKLDNIDIIKAFKVHRVQFSAEPPQFYAHVKHFSPLKLHTSRYALCLGFK